MRLSLKRRHKPKQKSNETVCNRLRGMHGSRSGAFLGARATMQKHRLLAGKSFPAHFGERS